MIKKELDNAFEIAKKGNSKEAFSICSRLLHEYINDKILILRYRSHISAYLNNLEDALADRLEIISIGTTNPQDYFFSGVFSLELSKYINAVSLFGESINLAENFNDKNYLEESFLLRGYAYLCIGDVDNAQNDCRLAGENVEYYIENDGPISTKRLVSYIKKLKNL